MPFTHTDKNKGDLIKSEDWNDAMEEIVRLGREKLEIKSGIISGKLTIESLAGEETESALTIKHNGSYNWGNALTIDQDEVGNSDGPKIRFRKKLSDSKNKSWSVGFLNGVNIDKFAVIEDSVGLYGTARMTISPGGEVNLGTLRCETVNVVDPIRTGAISFFKGKQLFPVPEDVPDNCLSISFGTSRLISRPPYLFRIGHWEEKVIELPNLSTGSLGRKEITFNAVMKVDQDGKANCDSTFTGGGADFAELFESETGEKISIGISVMIGDNGKIRPAQTGETPIGVISGSPAFLGNSPMYWPGKYERDEYGIPRFELVQEIIPISDEAGRELEILTEGGKELSSNDSERLHQHIQSRRKILNPDYDPTRHYEPRENRPEWQIVGLLGQIRITKGQPTAPSWVKIRDVSENVELWLVK